MKPIWLMVALVLGFLLAWHGCDASTGGQLPPCMDGQFLLANGGGGNYPTPGYNYSGPDPSLFSNPYVVASPVESPGKSIEISIPSGATWLEILQLVALSFVGYFLRQSRQPPGK